MIFSKKIKRRIKVYRNFSHINFDDESDEALNITIADYNEDVAASVPMSESNIPAENLVTEFGLELQAGRVDSNGDFTQLEGNAELALGETVHFVLTKNDGINDFK